MGPDVNAIGFQFGGKVWGPQEMHGEAKEGRARCLGSLVPSFGSTTAKAAGEEEKQPLGLGSLV